MNRNKSWFNVWDSLKNKTCRYLLQRYLGQFIEKLNLEQLNIELYNGKATLKNVSLRVEALNELLEAQAWPFEFTEGQIGMLNVSVPWNALMTSETSIEASDVILCLRPVKRFHECHESMIESMWSSVSSSLQLAKECMRQGEEEHQSRDSRTTDTAQGDSIGGLEKFAETIDNVLNRIQAKFTNIILRIQYPCHYKMKGVAINIHLSDLFYKNETGEKMPPKTSGTESNVTGEQVNGLPIYAKHSVHVTGVSVFTHENWLSEEDDVYGVKHEDIPILKILGQQTFNIKVKQAEEITGPKICFDVELGAVCAIFSPRQLQLVNHFLEAFSEDETLVYLNPTASADFDSHHQQFSNEYQEQYEHYLTHGNLNMRYDEFVHTNYPNPRSVYATHSNYYSQYENYCGSGASSLSSSTLTSVTRCQRKPTNVESCVEISNFVVKVNALIGVILQEDILVVANSNSHQHFWNERSLKEATLLSHTFFDHMLTKPIDQEISSKSLYCNKNHLFLRLNPIVIDGKQNRNKTILQINATVSATKVELCEILEEQVTHLLKFDDHNKNDFEGYPIRPELTMTFNSSHSIQTKKDSRSSIEINLEENILEFDISIIDRLGSFFIPSPYESYLAKDTISSNRDDVATNKTEFILNSPLIDVKLRFPIVDLRPLHDSDRSPWWKQNIRADYLLLRLSDFKLVFCEQCVKIYASQIEIFYVETENFQSHLLTTTFLTANSLEGYPQILVDYSNKNSESLDSATKTTKLPFSSKRHWRQCSTWAHSNNKTEAELMENLLLPGDKKELDDFCESTMANSNIQVKLYFPKLDFFIESKQLYEIIYNRLNSDLFMWEPTCPYITQKSSANSAIKQMGQSLLNMSMMDSVYISAIAQNDAFEQSIHHQVNLDQSESIHYFADEEEQDEDELISEMLMSKDEELTPRPHHCSVEIKFGQVSGSFFVPVRDSSKHILPQVCGKFLLNLETVNIFVVAGFRSDLNLSYLCTQVASGDIYHCGIVPMNTPLRFDHQAQVEDFMQSTLYKIPSGLTKGIKVPHFDNDDCDMFSIVIEIKKSPVKRVKRVKVAAGIHYATLRYNPSCSSLYWINQLIDFLDVVDYPIEGYKPYSVLSEMQLHLYDCAIDFRPENFPYRAVLELFCFSICSNIVPSMTCCNLRFVLEQCFISLAPYEELMSKKYPCYMISSICNTDLVTVLDIGLLDISLRVGEEDADNNCPTFDLRCSIQDVHFRTCYDSGSAFAQLIGYMANNSNGFNDQQSAQSPSLQSSFSSESDFLSQGDHQLSHELTKSQQERVNILMEDAVQDHQDDRSDSLEPIDEEEPMLRAQDEFKLYYFPDENTNRTGNEKDQNEHSMEEEPLPSIKAEFGEFREEEECPPAVFTDYQNISSNEEDYCIVAEDENYFANPSSSIEVCNDPLMVVDNHFSLPSPSCKDLLQAPPHYPIPKQRYTLCEMTITWHLYGGSDFSSPKPSTSAAASAETYANRSAMSDTYRQGVFYANETSRLQQIKKPKEKITWKSMGGPNRNHEVLVEMQFTKVKFSYEVYPRSSKQASRQVLLINEIEIRDRLQSSEINKFLYNANHKAFRNRKYRHMVMVRANHIRPNPQRCNSQECSLRISLSPLRLHIDQDTLEFLTDFFTNFGKACDKDNSADTTSSEGRSSKPHTAAKLEEPIMAVCENEEELPDAMQDLRARRIVKENISLLIDEEESIDSRSTKDSNTTFDSQDSRSIKDTNTTIDSQEVSSRPIYFREIIFSPAVSIRFDYHGRRIQLSKGPIAGLLMGLGQLQCSEIVLHKIIYRRGLLGFEKVFHYLFKEWLRDIKRNQLPKILSGVGPTYALVQLFQGVYDLFRLPIQHYQKDGRLIRGLQLGAQSFSARTILAALEIAARIIQLLQFTAETAFDIVSPGPSIRQIKKDKRGRKKRKNRPKDIREGVVNAYEILKDGINDSANNLIETAAAEHDQKGLTGAVGAVIRQVPQLVVCPAVLATQATTNILGGVKSSLVPEAKLEAKEKWKDNNC